MRICETIIRAISWKIPFHDLDDTRLVLFLDPGTTQQPSHETDKIWWETGIFKTEIGFFFIKKIPIGLFQDLSVNVCVRRLDPEDVTIMIDRGVIPGRLAPEKKIMMETIPTMTRNHNP